MSEVRVVLRYELYEQKSGEFITSQMLVVPLPIDQNGVVDIPLADVGTIINFNGTQGRVTERVGKGAEWTVRCVCEVQRLMDVRPKPLDPFPWSCWPLGSAIIEQRHARNHEGYVEFEPRPEYEQDPEKYPAEVFE